MGGCRHASSTVFFWGALTWVAPAYSGAWPTGAGNGFASASQTFATTSTGPVAELTSGYLEFGLSDRLTFGGKYDRLILGGKTALGFLRWHSSTPSQEVQLATEIGIGYAQEEDGTEGAIVSLAGILGRGLETRWGPGWTEVELRASHKLQVDQSWGNLDFTIGISPTETSHLILQARLFADRHSTDVKIVPSYVRQILPRLKGRIGLTYSMEADRALGIELGTWLSF